MQYYRILAIGLLLSFQGVVMAQDGDQLYGTYCAACHAPDGKGAGGQFPPLAGSSWVKGDPGRAVKVVLHGLHGKVDVDGRIFDLDMPPQGAVLSDENIAAILTYVRGAWGNGSDAVNAKYVKEMRDANAARKDPWTAEELQKLHPLQATKPAIDGLVAKIYPGSWKDIPNFESMQPSKIEQVATGIIAIPKDQGGDGYGIVWEGELAVPKEGTYQFRLDADDGARLLIDGKEVVRVGGIGPMNGARMREGSTQLKAGARKIRLEYYEFAGKQDVALAWNGPGLGSWRKLSASEPLKFENPSMVQADNGRAAIYRNFIAGTSARGIGIGFPGGVNLAYSGDNYAVELLWTGDFISGSLHWTERGKGAQAPAGAGLVKLTSSPVLAPGAKFKGYKLDAAGNPTFSVQLKGQTLHDSWKPAGSSRASALLRELSVTGGGDPLELMIAENLPLSSQGGGKFGLGNHLILQVENAVPETRGGKTYLKITPGKAATLNYQWK